MRSNDPVRDAIEGVIPTAPGLAQVISWLAWGLGAFVVVGMALIVAQALSVRRTRRIGGFVQRNPSEGQIMLIIGKLGAGKTAYAVRLADRLSKRYRLPVYGSGHSIDPASGEVTPLRDGWGVVHDWEDIDALPLDRWNQHPAILLLDEIHLWLSSESSLMPREAVRDAVRLLSFARKRGWTIIATTQSWTRVHTTFRQLVTHVMVARPVIRGRLHAVAMHDPDRPDKPIWRWAAVYRPSKVLYDTRAEVPALWSVGDGSRSGGRGAADNRAEPAAVGVAPGLLSDRLLLGIRDQLIVEGDQG